MFSRPEKQDKVSDFDFRDFSLERMQNNQKIDINF